MSKPKFNIGDKIRHPVYGVGIVKKIADYDPSLFYDVDFTIRGGDGTKAWLPKGKTEKEAAKV